MPLNKQNAFLANLRVVGLFLLALCVATRLLAGPGGWLNLVLALVVDGPVAALILLAGFGWGSRLGGFLLPASRGGGWLHGAFSCICGLWLLATALLVAGTVLPGGLSGGLWWLVVVAGAGDGGLRLIAAHRRAARTPAAGRESAMAPSRGSALAGLAVPVALGVACGLWLAGATLPVDFIGKATGDAYDVSSYHFQIPRDYLAAGRIVPLPHNTYSNYPLGGELLFLLAMILRGGSHEGMYAAKLMHGIWGLLAIAALWPGRDGGETPAGGLGAPLLFLATPGIAYLSWLGFVDLGEVACLAVAVRLLLLRGARRDLRTAAALGAILGIACTIKYLCVGFVVLPAMALLAADGLGGRPRRVMPVVVAGIACAICFLPWLMRNALDTGNPVFPLATGLLGTGHWDAEQVLRWNAGHAAPLWGDRLSRVWRAALDPRGFGVALPVLALVGAVVGLARRKDRRYSALLVAAGGIQVLVWGLATHMPTRFLMPLAVPMVLLADLGLRAVAGAPDTRVCRAAAVRRGAAGALVSAAVALGLWQSFRVHWREPYVYRAGVPDAPQLNGLPGQAILGIPFFAAIWNTLGEGDRLLMVGDARAYYFPGNTVYASVWERDTLAAAARETDDPAAVIEALRAKGVTHVYINWSEIVRVERSYGWWPEANRTLIAGLLAAGANELPLPGAIPGMQQLLALPKSGQ